MTQRYDKDEIRQHLGMGLTRVINIARDEREIDGHYIRMEKVEGSAEFWLEPVGGESTLETEAEPEGWAEVEASGGLEADSYEVTVDWLTDIDGIGKKGAGRLVEYLEGEDIGRTFAAVAALDDLTDLPSIGTKNGENLRAALEGEVPIDTSDSSDDEDPTTIEETEADLVDIRCPHCDGLFDQAKPGSYDASDWAHCEAFEGDTDTFGDCGGWFWLEVTDDGFETRTKGPTRKPGTGDAGQSEAEVVEMPTGGRDPNGCVMCGTEDDVREKDGSLVCYECLPKEMESEVEEKPPAKPKTPEPEAVAPQNKAPEPLPGTIIPRQERHHPMLPECRFMGKAEHDTDEWHDLRARGIGSSDAGAIMGFSDHATNQDVWATKIGEEPDEKPWLESYADFGTWFEPFLRHYLEEEHGIEIMPGDELGTLQWTGWDKALANIDGLDVLAGALEEYKTRSKEWRDVPLAEEAQCQHQMMVTGASEVRLRNFICPVPRDVIFSSDEEKPGLIDRFRKMEMMPGTGDRELADWLLDHGEVQTIIIERDEDYIRRMLKRERAFWEHVKLEIIPPIADPDGTVDLTEDAEAYAAMCSYGRTDREYSEVAKPLKKERDKKKKRARRAIDRAVGLDFGPDERPKRIKVGDHKATLSKSSAGNEYWRLYPGEEDVLMEVPGEEPGSEDLEEVANG